MLQNFFSACVSSAMEMYSHLGFFFKNMYVALTAYFFTPCLPSGGDCAGIGLLEGWDALQSWHSFHEWFSLI